MCKGKRLNLLHLLVVCLVRSTVAPSGYLLYVVCLQIHPFLCQILWRDKPLSYLFEGPQSPRKRLSSRVSLRMLVSMTIADGLPITLLRPDV